MRKAKERLTDLIDPNRALRELAAIAYSDIRQIFDDHGNLKPIHKWPDGIAPSVAKIEVVKRNITSGDGILDDVIKIGLWDKVRALEMIAKHLGLLVEKVQHSGGMIIRWDDGPQE